MNVLSVFLFFILIIFSSNSSAHLKWFVDNGQIIPSDIQYSLTSIEVIIGLFLLVISVIVAVILNKKITSEIKVSSELKAKLFRVFSILIGLSLVSASYSESVIAAHYIVSNPILVVLQYTQAIVGLMLIFNLFTTYAALALMFIYIMAGSQFGVLEVMDYLNILGIAIFLFLSNQDREQQKDFAVPAIRVFTGFALVVLAFSEKLLNPNLGLNFLALNDWNFMQTLGVVGYSNELFILSAGFVELLIGTLFILGVVTRINTLVLLAFMITSNVVFLIQNSVPEALTELAGHLPVVAIAIILLSSGAGKKWRVN